MDILKSIRITTHYGDKSIFVLIGSLTKVLKMFDGFTGVFFRGIGAV